MIAKQNDGGITSMVLGVLAGFMLIIALGWIMIVGALVSGLVSGIMADGTARGAIAAFIAGMLGFGFVIFLYTQFGAAFGSFGALFGAYTGITKGGVGAIPNIILATIAGAIGGWFKSKQ